ncbi:putative lipoprotein [Burkholderia pseudomallei]|nr:putative lipoprotein [Burkholderia pseudomallei]KGD43856.1 putative lipoprotein [Burkholderia pseudomallei]KGD50856.1 putative lipoprotein [Burkholderia pseudomallei]
MPNAWPTIAGSTVTSCSASYSAFHGVSTNSTPNAASSTASIRRTARSNGFIGDQST